MQQKEEESKDDPRREVIASNYSTDRTGNLTGFLVTQIIDSGIGINLEESRKSLFNTFAFYKSGADQLNKQTSGIGVGLNTAMMLSDALGGSIQLVSLAPKPGTQVNFKVATTNDKFLHTF